MGHWNYRLVRFPAAMSGTDEDFYAVHEVYYDDDGNVTGVTENAVGAGGDTPEEVIAVLERMIADVKNRPIHEMTK